MQVWSLFLLPIFFFSATKLSWFVMRLYIRDCYIAIKTIEGKVKPNLPSSKPLMVYSDHLWSKISGIFSSIFMIFSVVQENEWSSIYYRAKTCWKWVRPATALWSRLPLILKQKCTSLALCLYLILLPTN